MKRLWWRFFREWRVVYPDGGVSMLMPYKIARDYRSMFGGFLQPSYELPPCGMRTCSLAPYTEKDFREIMAGRADTYVPHETVSAIQRGMSWCRKCGNTWSWREPFSIPVAPRSSCFPVCKDCGPELTERELLDQVGVLITEWNRTGGEDDPGVPRPAKNDRTQVEYAARALDVWAAHGKPGEDPADTWRRLETCTN